MFLFRTGCFGSLLTMSVLRQQAGETAHNTQPSSVPLGVTQPGDQGAAQLRGQSLEQGTAEPGSRQSRAWKKAKQSLEQGRAEPGTRQSLPQAPGAPLLAGVGWDHPSGALQTPCAQRGKGGTALHPHLSPAHKVLPGLQRAVPCTKLWFCQDPLSGEQHLHSHAVPSAVRSAGSARPLCPAPSHCLLLLLLQGTYIYQVLALINY